MIAVAMAVSRTYLQFDAEIAAEIAIDASIGLIDDAQSGAPIRQGRYSGKLVGIPRGIS